MKNLVLLTFLSFASGAQALAEGELTFSIGGKNYSTANAQAVIETKAGKSRVLIAVKDKTQKFMLVFAAQLPVGEEAKPQTLTTADSALSLSLRTMQGTFAVMPAYQMAKATGIEYSERVDVVTDELEDDTTHHPQPHEGKNFKRRKRHKVRQRYNRVQPHWQSMSRKQRIEQGEGIIHNAAFKDAYFTLRLTPIVAAGKVVSYEGTFSGTGRYAKASGVSSIAPVQGGQFKVRVQYAN